MVGGTVVGGGRLVRPRDRATWDVSENVSRVDGKNENFSHCTQTLARNRRQTSV